MPDARTESSSPSPATGPVQDPAVRRRPRRRRGSKAGAPRAGQPEATDNPTAEDGLSLAEVVARLDGLTTYDREQLGRRLERVRTTKDARKRAEALQGVIGAVEQAERRVEVRRTAVPEITYPPELPVSQQKDEIAAAIRDHQVVIVAGETGSGKTTQIPKICLELGRGVQGMIGHTQPRRIAARTVAERIAEELGTELGETVGFKVRFTDQVSDRSLVKLMTDGILLAEIQRDRDLPATTRSSSTRPTSAASTSTSSSATSSGCCPGAPTSRSSSPRRPSTPSGSPSTSRTARARRRRSSRSPAGRIRSRCATARSTTRTTRARSTATRSRRSATPSTNSPSRRPATSWSSSPASGRSATPRTR